MQGNGSHPGAVSICALTLLLAWPVSAQDAAAGKQLFAQCSVCHSIDGTNGVGPSVQGVMGRKAGTFSGFRYSRAMKGANITWDDKALDAYITDPQKAIPGNVMPFSGITDAKQRADLIAYLKTLK
jgi:cytochrome c